QMLGQTFVDPEKYFLEEIPLEATGADSERIHKYPDLALLSTKRQDLPCVYLNDTVGSQERLFSYGYIQDYAGGEEAEFTYEGESWIDSKRRLLKFREGQVTYGLSGGPLLNLRTGGVCGIVQKTRSSKSDMGG